MGKPEMSGVEITTGDAPESLFWFEDIRNFDARKAKLKRCKLAGIGVRVPGRYVANCDFWREPSGHIVVRFYSDRYKWSFRATRAGGNVIDDVAMQCFSEAVAALALEWLTDGIDDRPDVPRAPEPEDSEEGMR